MSMLKSLRPLVALLCLVLALTSAWMSPSGAQASPPPSASSGALSPQPVSLTFWCSPYPAEVGWAIQMTRRFNASHPGIRVRLQAFPSGRVAEDVLREAIKTGTTPDLTTHLFPADVGEFARLGGLLPLEGFTRLHQAVRRRSGAQVERFRSADGHIYQLPWKCNPIMLACNKALMRKAGHGVPTTYPEFLQVARTLKTQHHVQAWALNPSGNWWRRYYDFYPLYLAASAGAGLLDGQGALAMDLDAAHAALELCATCFREDLAPHSERYPTDAALNEAFVSNQLAFLVTGPWNIPQIEEAGGAAFDFDFAPLPTPAELAPGRERCTYGNFRNLGVFRTCKHREAAATFAEFLLSKESDLAFLDMCSELPYRLSMTSDPQFQAMLARHRHLKIFAEQLTHVRSVDPSEHFGEALMALSRAWTQAVVEGSKDVPTALAELKTQGIKP